MIKKVRIRNYKCYGDRPADFDLARINFIYGDNSVGKSTFLQCLSRIYHMYDGGETTIPVSKALNDQSFMGVGADKIDIRIKTDSDIVWLGGVVDGQFALRDQRGAIVEKADYRDAVPWLRHAEAPRPRRIAKEGSALEALADAMIDTVAVNSMLERLGVGYKCIDKNTLEDVVLGRGGITVDDVGTGVDVMFDMVQSIALWQKGILLLEEPEANVNERQLESLTKVLVEESKKRFATGGQLVVECHSELVMLGIRNLLKHGVITPEDIAVFVVTKDSNGSLPTKIPLDRFGNILRPWPGGFFLSRVKIADAYYANGDGAQ